MALNSIRELRSFFVTYAPYLEFVLFLSHKTNCIFFVKCLVVLLFIYIFALSKITHFTE